MAELDEMPHWSYNRSLADIVQTVTTASAYTALLATAGAIEDAADRIVAMTPVEVGRYLRGTAKRILDQAPPDLPVGEAITHMLKGRA